MTSEGAQSYQYLSSSTSDNVQGPLANTSGIPVTIKDHVVLSNNNNTTTTNHFAVLPSHNIFEPFPETGVEHEPTATSTSTTNIRSSLSNPLSSTLALSTDTSKPGGGSADCTNLIHNNNNTITTKLTGNHLSIKNHRETVAPYSTQKSKSPEFHSTTDMYDSVMVSTLSSGGPSLNRGALLIPATNNHIHHHHLKLEPNGNSVDIHLTSSPESDDIMMIPGGGNHERLSSSAFGGNGGVNSDGVMMGLLHNATGGLGMSLHSNRLGLSSPGESLEDQDCDEEKVINGDTFSPGDVPDPDAIKMFVGQIPKHLSETELKTLFEEFGRVFQINVLRDKVNKQSKGCCFVTFYTRKAALDAQNALHNVKTLPGMNHPIQMKPADNENRYERKLFVGMLSKKCNESDIRNMFARFGHIDECTVLRDQQGTSRGCAFITFASKQCAQSAIKALHHSLTMEGCSSPVVVKFADTQKDKDQKRTQQISASILPGFQPQPTVNAISPQYFTLLQQLQQQQQQQSNNYFSSLSPLSGIATLASLASPSPGASLSGLTGSHGSGTNSDLAALAALANFTGVGVTSNQHSVAFGIQAALAAALNGTHSTLTQDYGYTNATNGSVNPLGSAGAASSALASTYTGNGLHTAGLSSYTSALRASVTAASKQAEGPEGANLFIYHLPPEATDPDLISMFAPFGTVISAKVYIDKNTNRSKCFGFVSYDNAMSAQVAIQTMNGFQVGMKRLKVQLKRSKEAAKPY